MATTTITFELDEKLKQQFVELAQAQNSSAEELLPYLIRDFIEAESDPEYNAWLQRQVQAGLDSLEAGEGIPGEQVEAEFKALREEVQRKLGGS
jgi:predicted transcriptional regulator